MSTFNEREAILMEMQDLKEQGRRDQEFYFEMRRHRYDRYNELQNRLRELDSLEYSNVPRNELTKERTQKPFSLSENAPQQHPESPIIIKEEPKDTKVESYVKGHMKQQIAGRKLRAKEIPIERIESKVHEYLSFMDEPQKTGDIQQYCELQLGGKWSNFTNIMVRLMERDNPIIRISHGKYGLSNKEKKDNE